MSNSVESEKAPSLLPLILIGTPTAILFYTYALRPVLNRLQASQDQISAREFAEKYKSNKNKLLKGSPMEKAAAKTFLEAANRRLLKISDNADLGDVSARTFIDELRTYHGISQSDFKP
jgi:hypothetical protein